MSDYAAAINAALGVASPLPMAAPEPFPHPVCKSQAKRLLIQRGERTIDLGQIYSETYRGLLFVVREKGAVSMPELPQFGAWSNFFTDEELAIEQDKGNVEGRAAACRRAIDRMFEGKPVWTRPFYERELTL